MSKKILNLEKEDNKLHILFAPSRGNTLANELKR